MRLACPAADHERWKRVDAWWLDQELIGYQVGTSGAVWELRNCRICGGGTMARRCERVEMSMDAPEGYWVSAEGYARLAEEMERANHLDLAKYFYGRALDAAVASFEEACTVYDEEQRALVDEMDPADWMEAVHAREEARAGR